MMDQDYTSEQRTVVAAIADRFRDACWKRTQPPTAPKTLYHYTTAQAFREILNSGTVWASDIRYMNDASEVTYASDILKTAIKDAMTSVHHDDERELLDRIAKTFNLTEMVRVFALCFSEFHDSIPQWTMYAGRRGGFAMGMQLDPFLLQVEHAIEGRRIEPGHLVKVVYDTDALRALSIDLVALVVTLYRQARDQFPEGVRNHIQGEFGTAARDGFSNLLL
jgi:hypothetical protein